MPLETKDAVKTLKTKWPKLRKHVGKRRQAPELGWDGKRPVTVGRFSKDFHYVLSQRGGYTGRELILTGFETEKATVKAVEAAVRVGRTYSVWKDDGKMKLVESDRLVAE